MVYKETPLHSSAASVALVFWVFDYSRLALSHWNVMVPFICLLGLAADFFGEGADFCEVEFAGAKDGDGVDLVPVFGFWGE